VLRLSEGQFDLPRFHTAASLKPVSRGIGSGP
jgi:hypothetical protein